MKNQNDLIVSAVSIVIGLILAIVFYATAPTVNKPSDPTTVDTSPPKLPVGSVQYANSLPGANSGGGSRGGRRGGGGGASMAAKMAAMGR